MSATLVNLIIQIVAGALGGNAAGAALKDMSLGTAGNTIAGAIGGGVGGQILTALVPMLSGAAGGVDVGAVARVTYVSKRTVMSGDVRFTPDWPAAVSNKPLHHIASAADFAAAFGSVTSATAIFEGPCAYCPKDRLFVVWRPASC